MDNKEDNPLKNGIYNMLAVFMEKVMKDMIKNGDFKDEKNLDGK